MGTTESRAQNSSPVSPPVTGVATGQVMDKVTRPAELERLEVFIGRWLTEGGTVPTEGAPATQIVASDIYQWVAGGHFVMHPAYGRIGPVGVGGLEVIGYDSASGEYITYFFDSQGNASTQSLSYRDGNWVWQGEHARCTGVFSDDGKTLLARHERSDDGIHWVPSMTVTLRKVD